MIGLGDHLGVHTRWRDKSWTHPSRGCPCPLVGSEQARG